MCLMIIYMYFKERLWRSYLKQYSIYVMKYIIADGNSTWRVCIIGLHLGPSMTSGHETEYCF